MTLETYLKKRGLTEEAFGKLVGLSQPQINRLRTGKSRPSWDALERIRSATGGVVTANDWMITPADGGAVEAPEAAQ